MKKKRDQTPSSTRNSTGNGKSRRKALRILRMRRVEERLETLEEKVSNLLRTLSRGELSTLPHSLILSNVVASQGNLSNELDGIKRYVADGIKRIEEENAMISGSANLIEDRLDNLNETMDLALDRLAEIRTTLLSTKNKEQTWKSKRKENP